MGKSGRAGAAERPGVPSLARLAARLSGARLCYGKPVEAAGRVVIPVASVRTAAGGGLGRSGGDEPSGGGGGLLDARPVGFIEIGPEGARYQAIDDERTRLRALAAGALALLALRRLGQRRRSRAALRPRRPVTLPSPRRLLGR